MSYPKWVYGPKSEPVIVQDEAAREALGSGWFESPADFPGEPAAIDDREEKPTPKPKKAK